MAEESEESTELVAAENTGGKAEEPSNRAEENKAVVMASTFGNETLSVASDSAKKTASSVLGAYLEYCAFRFTPYGDVLASNIYERKLSEKKAARLLSELDKIEPMDVTPSPTELSVPLIEQLSYTENDDLAEILIQLLAASGSKSKQHLVHPSMVNAARNLAPDEALILKWFGQSKVSGLSMISYSSRDPRPEKKNASIILRQYFSYLDDIPGLQFPENVELYAENLLSLGLFRTIEGFFLAEGASGENKPHQEYDRLKEKAQGEFEPHNKNAVFSNEKYMFRVTDKGRMFIKAVHKVSTKNTVETPDN